MADTETIVSIIMPCYNSEDTLRRAVDSVLAQSVFAWELFILDDGSRDGSVEIAREYEEKDPRIHAIAGSVNCGVAAVRNRGFDLCRRPYVALLDSDDVWHAEKLEKQLRILEQSGAELCYSSYALVDLSGKKIRPDYLVPERTDFRQLLRENVIGCSTVLMKRSLLDKYRFRTDYYHEDYVLWLHILRDGGRAVGCREVLVDWCYRQNSRSYNKFKSLKNRRRIYRDEFQIPAPKRALYLLHYALAGLRKYRSRKPSGGG